MVLMVLFWILWLLWIIGFFVPFTPGSPYVRAHNVIAAILIGILGYKVFDNPLDK